jgi:hypothetical protein
MTFDVAQIAAILRRLRAQKLTLNPGTLTDKGDERTVYGPPVVIATDDGWNPLLPEAAWDHSPWQLEELAEIAAASDGWVYLTVPVVVSEPADQFNGEWVDDGFAVRVYPSLALRQDNGWVEIP